jgi:hypothetical protein
MPPDCRLSPIRWAKHVRRDVLHTNSIRVFCRPVACSRCHLRLILVKELH